MWVYRKCERQDVSQYAYVCVCLCVCDNVGCIRGHGRLTSRPSVSGLAQNRFFKAMPELSCGPETERERQILKHLNDIHTITGSEIMSSCNFCQHMKLNYTELY